MNPTLKLKTPALRTHADLDNLIREIARLQLNQQALLTERNSELQAAHDWYADQLQPVTRLLEAKIATAQKWARRNPAAFGRRRRSLDFGHASAGFRYGTPRLQTLPHRQWHTVLHSLRKLRWGRAYLRTRQEINKEQILAHVRAGKLAPADLRRAGARVTRAERFFVEPKIII